MFFWAPVSPNSPVGTTTEILIPPGFSSFVGSVALNAHGAIVGNLSQPSGLNVPFLYADGNLYDISQIDDSLAGGSATGINDLGQIVVTSASGTFLLSPVLSQRHRER
ncbi:hypothetical protein SBA4_6720009 [Candidatus Sulfopaludibacter sp. SbA4]|nr:hypothetical protein SBA4_6720009 [Candidatus Sulfopaludibacter sp. SbA4]